MIAYLLSDRTLGAGGDHFEYKDFELRRDGNTITFMSALRRLRPCNPPITFNLDGVEVYVHVHMGAKGGSRLKVSSVDAVC